MPNACRHHSNGELGDARVSCRSANGGAQRLSASQQRGTRPSTATRRPRHVSAQRLSASQQRGTFRKSYGQRELPSVPNACRHHSNGEHCRGDRRHARVLVPNACRHHSNGEPVRRRDETHEPTVPNACRHHSNGEHADCCDGGPVIRLVPNACRHHSNGEQREPCGPRRR